LARIEASDGTGALADVRERHDFVTTLHQRSIEDHRAKWDEVIAAIGTSPKYAGLRVKPQLGLVPLGQDPDSGLFEFAHLGSGSVPKRDEGSKQLAQEDDAAIVLVLIPGGTFLMGAQKDKSKPNHDPMAESDEAPVHEVTLSPYFMAKYECTQAQWIAMTGGLDPSRFKAGGATGEKQHTLRNPVERVSWEDGVGETGWLARNRLGLPSEAQWEYACRAGADTPWFSGRDVRTLSKVANIGDAWLKAHGGTSFHVTPEVEDGHSAHAPVGSYAPNAFGLCDVHGNVWEWCRDTHKGKSYSPGSATDPLVDEPGPRVLRGGAWLNPAKYVRSALRNGGAPTLRADDVGFRPARPVTP
jgi:formylglycine-generating enzyme required for sulfatase activity